MTLRRDIDHRFRVMPAANGFSPIDAAPNTLETQMRIGEPPEHRPSGEQARRNPFHVEEAEVLNEKLLMLCSSAHHFAALHTIAEVYFALDRPDKNGHVDDPRTLLLMAPGWVRTDMGGPKRV